MSTEDPTYNEACAEVYDEWFGSCEEAAVDLLAELAGAGRVLELGIGSRLRGRAGARRGGAGGGGRAGRAPPPRGGRGVPPCKVSISRRPWSPACAPSP